MNDLYAAVVHDVKNQLTELALRLGKRGDAQQEMVIAMNSARRLSEMLLVHREATELLWVNPDTVNPGDFLEIVAAEFRDLFPHLSIDVDAARAPACAFFDDALVRLAFANAVHNACRHAQNVVHLSAYQEDGMLVMEVADDGPGFSENVLLSGGQLPVAISGTGTGLGLYLARKIAGLHQLNGRYGHIELSNANGGRFKMFLP
jgi:signal transduction histidine kinase